MPDAALTNGAIDHDVIAAVISVWKATPGLSGEHVEQLPGSGPLKSPQGQCYAHVACEPAGGEPMTGAVRIDKRKVTITIYGTKTKVKDVVEQVLARFHSRTELPMPSLARSMGWRPDQNLTGKIEQTEEAKKDGQDVWTGTVGGEVWTVRAY